jgi:uncharacterized protein
MRAATTPAPVTESSETGRARTVTRLSITPVKETALHHPARVRIDHDGVAENRRFFVVTEDGRLPDARTIPVLMRLRADYDPGAERLALRFPDGRVVEGDAESGEEPFRTVHNRRTVVGRVLDGPWAEALSALAGQRLRLVRAEGSAAGSVYSEPLSIVSSASVEALGEASGHRLDARRFRMLIEVGSCRPREEESWIGGRVRIGPVLVEVIRAIPRCAITQLDPDSGEKDFPTLDALVRYRGTDPGGKVCFGVHARVLEPGWIALGDPVEPLDPTDPPALDPTDPMAGDATDPMPTHSPADPADPTPAQGP